MISTRVFATLLGSVLLMTVPFALAHADDDPPAIVGRLAKQAGPVSFRAPTGNDWQYAGINQPLYRGSALWTEPGAQALVEFPHVRLAANAATELDITDVGARSLTLGVPRGALYLHLIDQSGPNEVIEIQMPRGMARIAQPGRYAVTAGDADHPAVVTVVEGSASVTGDGFSVQVDSGQTASIGGTGPFTASTGPRQDDPFLTAQLAADNPPRPQVALPPVVTGMTGEEDLAAYGQWQNNSDEGPVWYPNVPADWVPYRDGTWRWVQPWGWTWFDAAPWGFAPSHYGRWVMLNNRWAWTPCAPHAPETAAPVYSPAVVSFFDMAAGAAIGAGAAAMLHAHHPEIGWVPLGPHEPYGSVDK